MESINMSLTVHKVNDPNQNLLVDQQWDISDPILFCTNQDLFPIFFLNQPEELTLRFHVWDSGLPLCIVPQVYHFPELVVRCAEHYATNSKFVITEKQSQIFIIVSPEEITKMLGLHMTDFPTQSTMTLTKEVLVKKFTSLSPQDQMSFVQGIQRPNISFPVSIFK